MNGVAALPYHSMRPDQSSPRGAKTPFLQWLRAIRARVTPLFLAVTNRLSYRFNYQSI